jgi:hypothetical protein
MAVKGRSLTASPNPKALTNPFRKVSACPAKKGLFKAKDLKRKIRGKYVIPQGCI